MKRCKCPRCEHRQQVETRNLLVACRSCSSSFGDKVLFVVVKP